MDNINEIWPKNLINYYFKNCSGISFKEEYIKIIYSCRENLEKDINPVKEKNDFEYIKINDIKEKEVIIEFDSDYINIWFDWFENNLEEKKYKIAVDIGSWNPYAMPTVGQVLNFVTNDKIFKIKKQIEKENDFIYIYFGNDIGERIDNEIKRLQNGINIYNHDEIIMKFYSQKNELKNILGSKFLTEYYIQKYINFSLSIGVYWKEIIKQSQMQEEYFKIKDKINLPTEIKIDRNNKKVVEYKSMVIEYLDKKQLSYLGSDLMYFKKLKDENYKKLFITVAYDHKGYENTIKNLVKELDFCLKDIELIFSPLIFYKENGNSFKFSKSGLKLGGSLKNEIEGLDFITHYPFYSNLQKNTAIIDLDTIKYVKKRTQMLKSLIEITKGKVFNNTCFPIMLIDMVHKIYLFKKINIFDDIQKNVEKKQCQIGLKILRLIYQTLN